MTGAQKSAACCDAFFACLCPFLHKVLMCALICCRFHIQGHSELHLGDIHVQCFCPCKQSCLPFRCPVIVFLILCTVMSAEQQQCLMAASCMSSCATAIITKSMARLFCLLRLWIIQTCSLLVLMHKIEHAKPLLMEVCMQCVHTSLFVMLNAKFNILTMLLVMHVVV